MIERATTGGVRTDNYREIRSRLIGDSVCKERLPQCVLGCRTLDEFWGFIKPTYATYAERREFIRESFESLLSFLERATGAPSDGFTTDVLATVNSESISVAWQKALTRRTSDPDGAITIARTLVESVCKHILDEGKTPYSENADLPKLYSLTAASLKLPPSQHTEQVFKQILGGCHGVVEGLGSLRNRLGNAHGSGKVSVRPLPRHAELAVNLAGALATFLLATWDARRT